MTPDTAAPPPSKGPRPPSLTDRLRAAPVTVALFSVCIVVFALAESHGSTKNTQTLLRFGATWRENVWQGEWWRLFTAMFLHIGVVHLVWNLWMGFSWSAPFERLLGPWRFLFVYLLSGLAGSAASVIGHDAVSAGASGALFGVVGGIIVIQRKVLGSWAALWSKPEQRHNLLMMALWLALGPFVGFDSFAHGGGLLAGAALTWTMLPLRLGNLGAAVAAVALLVWVSLRPIPGPHDAWILRQRAQSAWEQRDWRAVVAATEVEDLDLRSAWLRVEALVALGRATEAEPLLARVTGPAGALAGLKARVRYSLAKYDAALADLEEGLVKSPDQPELLEWKVRVLLAQGRAREADQVAARVLELAPASPRAHAERARTLAALSQSEPAMKELAEAMRLAPGEFDADHVELLAGLGQYAEAREVLGAAKLEPAQVALLGCYLELAAGQFEAAQRSCDATTQSHPGAREFRAAVACGRGDCEGARKLLQGAPKTRFVQVMEATCLIQEQRWEEARALAGSLLDQAPNDPDVLMLLLALSSSDEEWNAVLPLFEGHEREATRSLVWPLLPARFREAFPRR